MAKKKTTSRKKAKPKRNLPFNAKEKKHTLAARVNHALEQANMSVAELAYAAGCSDMTIHNILNEKGVMLNNGNTLLGIAMALEVELDWLVHNIPNKRKAKVKTGAKPIARRNSKKYATRK